MVETINSFGSVAKEGEFLLRRVLYLTKDSDLIRKQIEGIDLTGVKVGDLLSDVSTDAIIPTSACLLHTGKEEGYLGDHLLTGLKDGVIKPGEIRNGNFQAIVAGPAFAKGSSRIHAPIALLEAGINVVIADAERIFKENCVTTGIHCLSPQDPRATKLITGQPLNLNELTQADSVILNDILKHGGLLKYFKALEENKVSLPKIDVEPRTMTIVEKIAAKKLLGQDPSKATFVEPGIEGVVVPDQYYGYELQTPVVRVALRSEFGDKVQVKRPDKTTFHSDHTALLVNNPASVVQRDEQTSFSKDLGITVYEVDIKKGAPAICHTAMIEDRVEPGQLILGNDSHTCTLGVLNTLAVGKGAIDLAGAMVYDKMVITIPESIRINLKGEFRPGVTAKDFMLQLGASPFFKEQRIGSGRVFEYGGESLDSMPLDEQLKLTNMSIELLGFSGVVEPNKQIVQYMVNQRGFSREQVADMLVYPDSDAQYVYTFDINLSTIVPTVAEPGDPKNGVPLSEIKGNHIRIQKAYLGSCTHGTVEDLRQAAEVLEGRHVADDVKFYFQASSLVNLAEAERLGYVKTIKDAGGIELPIGCGACMNAGPGTTEEGETAIFVTNRNLDGRTGKGQTYLGSAYTAAASAVAGYLCSPQDLDS